MLKELLLQFVVSLLPGFAYQLWYNKEQEWRSTAALTTIYCGLSMTLCMLTAPDVMGFTLDFHWVPYIIGSLYAGKYAWLTLTPLIILLRIPSLDSSWETISFFVLVTVLACLLLASLRTFRHLDPLDKERRALKLISLVVVYLGCSLSGYLMVKGLTIPWSTVAFLGLGIVTILTATWLSVFMVESVREKHQLHLEVVQISANFRNEVEKLQQFIDETSVAVVVTNRGGTITHCNSMAATLIGVGAGKAEGDVLGLHFMEAFEREADDTHAGLLNAALQGSKTVSSPYILNERMLLSTAFFLRNFQSGEIEGAALLVQDITEISQLRDELGRMERLSLVGQMAASITHEIRNPMAVIRGFVQLLQERSPGNQQEYYRIVMEELDRANMIISDFLSLAQNRVLKMDYMSLHDIINDLIPLLNADSNLRGQTIELQLADELPQLMLNEREIKQMLLNLARNGMEAMNDKGVLRISTRLLEDCVELRISDEGVGIPSEQMKHLFEPFFTTKTKGTGLGLPLCLSIAERHNGKIEVDSVEGEGTTFIVTFNLAFGNQHYGSSEFAI